MRGRPDLRRTRAQNGVTKELSEFDWRIGALDKFLALVDCNS